MTYHNAHAARIEDGIVREVIVIPHLDDDDAKITEYCNRIGLAGTWIDTSYTGSRRGKYAGVGDSFDVNARSGEGEFVSPGAEPEPEVPEVPEVPEAGASDFVYEWGSTISAYSDHAQKIYKVDKNGQEMPEPSAWDTLRYQTVLSDGSIYDATYPVSKFIDYSAYRRVYIRPNNALTIDPGTEVIVTLTQNPAMWSDETLSFVAQQADPLAPNLGDGWSGAGFGLAAIRFHASDLDGKAVMNIAEGKQLVINDSNGGNTQIAITSVQLNESKPYMNINLASMPPNWPTGTRIWCSVV